MVDVEPTWINADAGAPAYTASELRRNEAVLMFGGVADRLGVRQGVRPGADPVSLAGTTVTVHETPAVVYPAVTSTSGPYRVALLETAHELNPPDGTYPRKDIIVCQVQDHDEDASGFRRARSVYVPGSPAATPVEPAVPAGAFRMGTITVPQSGGGGATLVVNTPWAVAAGGILPVRNDAELPGASGGIYDGMARWNQDTNALEIHNGGSSFDVVASAHGYQYWQQIRYTASSTFDPNDPAFKGWRAVRVRCQGGGGAGGGAVATAASETSCGAGGQGGAYGESFLLRSDVTSSVTVTRGAGGTAVAGGAGNNGGTSSFGTLVSGGGGQGGDASGSGGNAACLDGGNSVQAMTGEIQIGGQGGGVGCRLGTSGSFGGIGGSSQMGGGAAGNGPSNDGHAARQFGGGGGGANNAGGNFTAKTGGSGSDGIVIVDLYV
jgi:hypothetical protein